MCYWKEGNLKEFNNFWDSVQQDKEVVFVLLCKELSHANIFKLPGL